MEVRGEGRVIFASILLLIAGVLNVVYGIAAIGESTYFTEAGTRFVFSDLNTWGWVILALGVLQLTGGFSLFAGGTYGRVIGLVGASLGAVGALLAVGGAYPWWSLGIFALCVFVIHGLLVYGESPDGNN